MHKVTQTFESLVVFLTFTLIACSHTQPVVPTANEITQPSPITSIKPDLYENRVQTLREEAYGEYLRGEFPRAISHLETALTLDVQGQEVWPRYILFYCYMAVGEYEHALSVAENIVKDHSFQSLPYQQVGLAQLWLGQVPNAIQNFQRALDFEAHSPRVHFYLGLAYAKLGQESSKEKAFADAKNEYEQILKANPKDFNANYELASLFLFWNKNIDKVPTLLTTTRESFTPAAEEDVPQEKKVYLNFYIPLLEAILMYQKGSPKDAQKVLLDLVQNIPSGIKADLAEIYFYLGKTYQSLGDPQLAKSFLEKSASLDSKGAYALQTQHILRTITSQGSTVP